MKTYKKTAVIVGVLYIIGTVSGVLSLLVTRNLISGEDFLAKIAANPAQLNLGAFFVLLMGVSLAAMPVFLYPLFRRKNEALALGMVVFRGTLEGCVYILIAISWLLLAVFSVETTMAESEAASSAVIGEVLRQAGDTMGPVLTIVFIIGAILLYTLFYLTKLIPRWLSGWGLIGAVIYLAVDLFKLFGFNFELDILYVPLAIQEMVMALWLIIKGFNQIELGKLLSDKRTL